MSKLSSWRTKMIKKLIAVAAFAVNVFSIYADGESLAETGGYVTTEAQLAFKGITLNELGTAYVPSAKMSGGWVTADGLPVSFCARTEADGVVRYQAQAVEGSVKAVAIEFTDGEGGVYARANVDQGFNNSDLTYFGKDIYINSSAFAGVIAASADDGTYGIHGLGLVSVDDLDAICINFNNANDTMVKTYEAVGAGSYAVTGFMWSQMLGTNNNTMNGVRLIDSDTSATLDLPSVSVTVTGTRGTYSWSGYNSDKDVRYGYIDENGDNPTPTVTISNVPFEFYKVVFYASTDNENSKFGYVSVNNVSYNSGNSEKDDSADYPTTEGSAAWGKSRVSDYKEGVNYLVTPVIAATADGSVKVVGHKQNGRGCIAAIQIVKAEPPETLYSVTATGDVTWSTKTGLSVDSGSWASGNSILLKNNLASPVTVTFDEVVDADRIVLSGSGRTILKFSDPSFNQIAAFDFYNVDGEVAIDDDVATEKIAMLPQTGELRFAGTSTLKTIPYNGVNADGAFVIDQPVTITDESQLILVGNKKLLAFDENCNASFVKMVLGNYGSAVQTIEQRGGSVSITGTTLNGNQSSLLFAHYGSTVTMRNLGGAFTGNAAVRFGWDGTMNWTIGDGESDNATAVVTVPGLQSGYGRSNSAVLTLTQGGTLNLGSFGIQANSANVSYVFSGGTLCFTADSQISSLNSPISLAAQTTSTLDTGAFTVTNGTIITGSGNLVKKGSGTLRMSASASATGTVQVDAGTLSLDPGVVWGGEISLGENGTLDIVDNTIDESSTLYIPVGRALTVGSGTVKLNGTALNTEVWELSGGTLVNKTLKNATTTATGDISFSTSTWNDALGDSVVVDWAGYLSEVRVNAENNAPATVTVDVNAAQVKDFVVDGAGDLVFVASGIGNVSAQSYNFSTASGRVEYTLPTGESPVISGADTVLSGGGSGAFSVANGKMLTLGPWGTAAADGITYEFLNGGSYLTPATGSTLVFSPGEGKVQKTASYDQYHSRTTIVITNGTYVADKDGGGDGFFGSNSIRIDNGGVLSLENATDLTGYNNTASTITINEGGTLQVKMRDTLRRPVVLNGGAITVQGEQGIEGGPRALDMYDANTVTVTKNSLIQAIDDGTVANPIIYLRGTGTTFNIDDGISLVNNVTYQSYQTGTVTIRGTMNNGNGNGRMVMNGFNGNPITFTGLATIGERGKPVMYELNCEHQNGTYVVNANSRLLGSGSITGNGGVTLAAENSKICGSLTVNNVTATSGGTYGDQWNAVAAKVATSYFAAGTQTIQNGSFTIGANCVVTNSEGAADTTAAEFSIATNGNLRLEKSVTVARLTVADGGTITLGAASKNSVPVLNVAGNTSFTGSVNFIIDFGSASAPGGRTYTLMTGTLPNIGSVEVRDNKGERRWKVSVVGNDLRATSNGSFHIRLR